VKRRLVKVFLIAFALWPLAQFALVTRFEVSPWKLAGWAMYTAPTKQVGVAVFAVRPGRPPQRLAEATLPEPVSSELRRFVDRRRTLGRLASPDAIGRELFARRSDLAWTVVAVETRHLDRDSAMIEREMEKHVYHRGTAVDLATVGADAEPGR
jgi:hypothetical protein